MFKMHTILAPLRDTKAVNQKGRSQLKLKPALLRML